MNTNVNTINWTERTVLFNTIKSIKISTIVDKKTVEFKEHYNGYTKVDTFYPTIDWKVIQLLKISSQYKSSKNKDKTAKLAMFKAALSIDINKESKILFNSVAKEKKRTALLKH